MKVTSLLMPLAAALTLMWGCDSIITQDCRALAEPHCQRCISCASADISTQTLCGVDDAEDLRESCLERLTESCEDQSALVDDFDNELTTCEEAFSQDSCDAMRARFALDKPPVPAACRVLF